jgi:hypothetical protein
MRAIIVVYPFANALAMWRKQKLAKFFLYIQRPKNISWFNLH